MEVGSSQEVETLTDILGHLLLSTFSFSVGSQVHEKFRNLVSIHARSWHFDGSCPIVIVVTKSKGEFLQGVLLHLRIIECNIEVSRQHTALSGKLRDQEEVILHVRA